MLHVQYADDYKTHNFPHAKQKSLKHKKAAYYYII